MICNSTPLIYLAKINQLELLKKLFHKITITQIVKEEVLIEGKPGYSIINNAIKEGWIKIFNPKKDISLGIDKGENSTINLAREKKDTLIIDDALGIKIAKSFNIDFIRTTSVIIMSLKKNIINKEQAISFINKIIDAGYYLSPNIYSKIMQFINEA